MKTRIIQTKFWDDPLVIDAPIEARLLFMYYLTCPHIGMTGVFEISDREVNLKTGLSANQIVKAKKFLQENDKIRFYKTWVKVVNASKYNNYGEGEHNIKAYQKEIESISLEVLEKLDTTMDSTIEVLSETSDSNHKYKIRNKKLEIEDESVREGDFSKIEDILQEDVIEIANANSVPYSFVYSKLDDMRNWRDEDPQKRKKKNWKATLRVWVKKDAMNIQKEAHGQSKIAYINTDSGESENPVQDQTDQRNGRDSGPTGEESHPQGIGSGGTLHSGQGIYVDGELNPEHRAALRGG